MPKRTRCGNCGTSTYHKNKYNVVKVVGTASGKDSKIVKRYCEVCWTKLSEVDLMPLIVKDHN